VQIFVFVPPTAKFGIWRHVIYRWKGPEITFPAVYYMPPNVLKLQLQNEKEKYVVI
jgi:hypothetical protein